MTLPIVSGYVIIADFLDVDSNVQTALITQLLKEAMQWLVVTIYIFQALPMCLMKS
jgi:hypothetical protein